MPTLSKFFSHFQEFINIIFYSWIPHVLRFLMLIFLVLVSSYAQRREKNMYREIINKKSTKFVYKKKKLLGLGTATEPLDCSICLLEFEHGDKGRKLENCGHIFHENCLEKWLMHGKRHATCPLCRSVIIPENIVEEHMKVEDKGLNFVNIFEEELALLLLSGLNNGCSTQRC